MIKLINKTTRISRRYLSLINPIKKKYCCICDHSISDFMPYKGGWKEVPSLMKVLNVVGSDVDNFSCPVCGSHDRERHQWLYWKASQLPSSMKNATILHFAPENHLAKLILQQNPAQYIKADLYPTSNDIQKVDLLDMPFEDNTFDFLIANHVLEHVNDLETALLEIHRVVKPHGWVILQTPYSPSLEKTWEDTGIKTEKQRLFAYGQEDHVRLFGEDIFQTIESTGFISHVRSHNELLNQFPAKRFGVNEQEPFMTFQKQQNDA